MATLGKTTITDLIVSNDIKENGSKLTDKYVSKSGDTINGRLTVSKNGISIGGTDNAESASLDFLRATYNYISSPSGSNIGIHPGGIAKLTNTGYKFDATAFYPGATNTYNLGSSSLKWNNVYATTFNGNLTGTADNANKVTMAEGTADAWRNLLCSNGSNGVCYEKNGWLQMNYSKGALKAKSLYITGSNSSNAFITADNGENMYFNTGGSIPLVLYKTAVRPSISHNGQIDLGTSDVQWKSVRGVTLYENGVELSNKYEPKTNWYTITPYKYQNNLIYHHYTKIATIQAGMDHVLRFRIFEDVNYPSYGEYVVRINHNTSYGQCVSLNQASTSTRNFYVYISSEVVDTETKYHVWILSDIEWTSSIQFKIEKGSADKIVTSNWEQSLTEPSDIVYTMINNGSCRIRHESDGTVSFTNDQITDTCRNHLTANKFIKSHSDNNYVLLGGGGHKSVSDFATSSHTHNYLPLSGGTLTNDLTINCAGNAQKYINFRDGGTSYDWRIGYDGSGNGDANYLVFQSSYNKNDVNSSSWNSALQLGLTTYDATFAGNILPKENNTKNLGSSSLKWNNVYATTFNGNLSGNATSASKLNLSAQVGGSYRPVYFKSDGTPSEITGIGDLSIVWNSASSNSSLATISPLDVASSSLHSANRLAFANPSGITVEYSTDGTNWVDYGLTDAQKIGFVSDIDCGMLAGKGLSTKATANDKLRITFDAQKMGVYTMPKSLLIYMSTNGSVYNDGNKVRLDVETAGTDGVFKSYVTNCTVAGWAGWNKLPLTGVRFGGGLSDRKDKIRLTFSSDGAGSSYTSGAHFNVIKFVMIGEPAWGYPSAMASNGHLYGWKYDQTMTLPSGLEAKNIIASKPITLSGTTRDTARLIFSRSGDEGFNYINWPGNTSASNVLAFGYSNSSDASYYYMCNEALYPASNKGRNLGKSDLQWNNVYAKEFVENGTSLVNKYAAKTHQHTFAGTPHKHNTSLSGSVSGGILTITVSDNDATATGTSG